MSSVKTDRLPDSFVIYDDASSHVQNSTSGDSRGPNIGYQKLA